VAAGAGERGCADSLARARAAGGWDDPASRCVPADAAAAVVVERGQDARRRGADALAAVAGWGFASSPSPVDGFAAAMAAAVERAGGGARSVDAVVLHDERCAGRDAAEREAVAAVFGARSGPALVSSKDVVGHALAGGAAADVALSCRMLAEGALPGAEAVPGGKRPRRVVVNACGWGGSYAAVVLDAAG